MRFLDRAHACASERHWVGSLALQEKIIRTDGTIMQ